MKFLGTLLVFAGYVFVYASVAAGGKFATEPWAGLFADAYTGAQVTGNTGVIGAIGTQPSNAQINRRSTGQKVGIGP